MESTFCRIEGYFRLENKLADEILPKFTLGYTRVTEKKLRKVSKHSPQPSRGLNTRPPE